MFAPQVAQKRCRPAREMIGRMPGITGTSIPASRTEASQSKYTRLSKKSWLIRNSAPLSTFSRRNSMSASGEAASWWISGWHEAPIPKPLVGP